MDVLGLEVAGEVRAVGPAEVVPRNRPVALTRIRDSHHLCAQLIASGMRLREVAFQTGYSYGRLEQMHLYDPTFRELVEAYRGVDARERAGLAERCRMTAEDFRQDIHERLLDGEAFTIEEALAAFKLFNDRGGNAPVGRSVSVSAAVGYADRLDAAKARREAMRVVETVDA